MTAPGLEEHSGNQRNEMPTAQSACRPASFSAAKSSMTIGYGHDFPELPGRRQVLRHAQLCWWQDRPAETFLELYLFEQEIGHRTPKTGVLKLQVSDLAHLSAPNWDVRAFGTWASHGIR